MTALHISSFATPWGKMSSAATERGLAVLTLPGQPESLFHSILEKLFPDWMSARPGGLRTDVERQIIEYLNGRRAAFDLPLDLRGTPFQKRVLAVVATIPYGHTRTYAQVAQAAGKPRAYRAVGMANALNPLPLVIPCHRVVASDGLGGYGGGIAMKRRLLELEGAL